MLTCNEFNAVILSGLNILVFSLVLSMVNMNRYRLKINKDSLRVSVILKTVKGS